MTEGEYLSLQPGRRLAAGEQSVQEEADNSKLIERGAALPEQQGHLAADLRLPPTQFGDGMSMLVKEAQAQPSRSVPGFAGHLIGQGCAGSQAGLDVLAGGQTVSDCFGQRVEQILGLVQ